MNPAVPVQDLVSTIIPVYNRSAWVEEALQSVLQQTHSHCEILLCDDGSDEEPAVALDRLVELDPDRIRVLHLPHHGPGPTRQAGLEQARGEFIQYLDSDDRLHPEKFERQITALREHPDCGIAYGKTRLIDQDGAVLQESYKRIAEKQFLFPGLLVDRWWCTHTPLYRREVCDRVGPWSDLRYSQDWEYDARAGALKTKLVFVDQVVSDHRDHRDPQRQTGRGRWLAPADQLRFFKSLHACALQSGVPADAPEMKHFVRWVFAAARSAGRIGDITSARPLLALAKTAQGSGGLELSLYGLFGKLFGWAFADSLTEGLRRLLGRRAGSDTQLQSWMKEAHDESA